MKAAFGFFERRRDTHRMNQRAMRVESLVRKRKQRRSRGLSVHRLREMLGKNTGRTQRQTKFLVVAFSRGFNRFHILLELREQPVINGPHVARVRRQSEDKILRTVKADSSRDQKPRLFGLGYRVRLQSVLHLQPVLQRPQKVVRIGKFTTLLLRDELPIRKSPETHKRVRHAQPIIAPAMGQLQRLRDELNLANATAPEFHVVTTLLLRLPIDLLL